MKRFGLTMLVAVFALQGCSLLTGFKFGDEAKLYRDLLAEVKPALVRVVSTNPEGVFLIALSEKIDIPIPKRFKKHIEQISGSGFVIDAGGVVITNRHVLPPIGWHTKVIMTNGKVYQIKDSAAFQTADIAILRLKGVVEPLPFVEFARKNVQVGDSIFTYGRNKYFDFSFKTGVVSHPRRENGDASNSIDIQTTMPVIPGESGSAVFNLEGKVIGVVQAHYPMLAGVTVLVPGDIAKIAAKSLRIFLEKEEKKKRP